MSATLDSVQRAQRDFIAKMYGIAPNRVMMTDEEAEKLKAEVLNLTHHDADTTGRQFFVLGMRVVIDPFAVGVEVGYVR